MSEMEKSNNKRVEVSDYFDNPADSRWTKFKEWASKLMEKLPNFVQDVTGIDLDDPIKSLKEKFSGNKKKSKIPESDSKIIGSSLPSSMSLIGAVFFLSLVSGFFSVPAIIAVGLIAAPLIKAKGVISSDEGKEGTIHNPIRNGSEDYIELGTKTITYNDDITTRHADKIKNRRDGAKEERGLGL